MKIKNDTFAMALYPNWETIPGENNLNIWIRNSYGELLNSVSVEAMTSSYCGYVYKIPSNIGTVQGEFEGHSYLYAKKLHPLPPMLFLCNM